MNARRKTMARQPLPEDGLTCKDCAHARDFRNRSIYDGHFIMCSCDYQEHDMMLNVDRCEHFKRKEVRHDDVV